MRPRHWLAGLLAAACLTAAALAQTETPPDASLFAPVQIAGDQSTGFPAYYYGCADNGATLQDIIVYANNNFLRGIEVSPLQHFGYVPSPRHPNIASAQMPPRPRKALDHVLQLI